MSLPPQIIMDSQRGEDYEQKNVHDVYQEIAGHFSATRFKVSFSLLQCPHQNSLLFQPWPIVERFLTSLSPGAVGLDVGCGNGKNLMVNRDVLIIASDRYVMNERGAEGFSMVFNYGISVLQSPPSLFHS